MSKNFLKALREENSKIERNEEAIMTDFTPHQQNIIRRYYEDLGENSLQRLSELATDLYLATGKKRAQCWKYAVAAMQKLQIPQSRIDHILEKDDPVLLVKLVEELRGR